MRKGALSGPCCSVAYSIARSCTRPSSDTPRATPPETPASRRRRVPSPPLDALAHRANLGDAAGVLADCDVAPNRRPQWSRRLALLRSRRHHEEGGRGQRSEGRERRHWAAHGERGKVPAREEVGLRAPPHLPPGRPAAAMPPPGARIWGRPRGPGSGRRRSRGRGRRLVKGGEEKNRKRGG
jgi:hypothetical protein